MTSGKNHNDINAVVILITLGCFVYWKLSAAFIILWGVLGWIFTYRFPPDFFDIKCESSKHHKIISWVSRQIFDHRKSMHYCKTWVLVFGLMYAGVVYAENIFLNIPITDQTLIFNTWVFGGLQAQLTHIAVDNCLPY